MKIGIYIEHGSGNGVGGAELAMAYLASSWSRDHDVDLIHHRAPLTRERIASFSTDGYERVRFVCVPRDPEPPTPANPLRRYRAAAAWGRRLSEGYDVFVNCTHWLPCFSHAKLGVLLVLFPFYVPPHNSSEIRALPLWKQLRHRTYYEIEWRARLRTYRRRLAISEFTREWIRRRWGVTADVVYPPVDVRRGADRKEPVILSVGRFSTLAHRKKQLEMVRTFAAMEERLPGWSFRCVGGLNDRDENHRFFEQVRDAASDHRILVAANLDRASVAEHLERSSIYWHATGFDDDTDLHPELCEHFGIATVEAMAAGCVPVVVNKGGQPEIVQHGESGFLWNSLDELRGYTMLLANDGALRERMSRAARLRAQRFSRERFLADMTDACGIQSPLPAAAHPRLIAERTR